MAKNKQIPILILMEVTFQWKEKGHKQFSEMHSIPDENMNYGKNKNKNKIKHKNGEERYGMHVVRSTILKTVPWEGHEKVTSEQGSIDSFPGSMRIHFCSLTTFWLLPMYGT